MSARFLTLDSHVENPLASDQPRVVLSRLPRGESLLGRPARSIKFILEQEESYVLDGRSYRLLPGQMLIVEPGTSTIEARVRQSGGVGLCLYLDSGPGALIPHVGEMLADGPVTLAAAGNALGSLLTRAAAELARNPEAGARYAPLLIRAASRRLTAVLEGYDDRVAEIDASKASTRRDLLRRAEIARAYLHGNMDRAVPLQELATHAGASPFHLARTFRNLYGVPPASYHRDIRLEAIAKTLSRDQISLTDAAGLLGFSDQASFTKAFRRKFGMPPGSWARRGRARQSA